MNVMSVGCGTVTEREVEALVDEVLEWWDTLLLTGCSSVVKPRFVELAQRIQEHTSWEP